MPDDFKLVKTRKRGGRNTNKKKAFVDECSQNNLCSISKETIIRRTLLAKEETVASDFCSSVLVKLSEGLNELTNLDIKEIICYGLGSFADSVTSRYQFALLLALKEHFSTSVLIYDPIFNDTEIDVLKELGCQVITINEEGKHKIQSHHFTLLYLPHCPKQLINNFLWTNWGPELQNCIIFSNSFSRIIESQPKRFLTESAGYILNIFPYTEELEIDNCFRYNDIFNDTAIHIFPQKKLNSVPQNFWDLCEEPKYCEDDTEFIGQKLISTLKV
ncbi:SRR1-like protein isoform X2 [Periplaneta americana]